MGFDPIRAGALAVVMLLSACATALVTGMPLTTVIRAPDGTQTVMSGKIMPSVTYASTFTLSDATGRTCDGAFSPKGVGSMTCSDGFNANLQVPADQYGRMSGAYVQQSDGIGVAVGWGSKSDAVALAAMFPAR